MSRKDKEGMSKRREKTIRLNRFGNALTYERANGKSLKNISVSHGDHTLYVYIAFTDDTEVAVHFNTLPVADVTLCGYVHGDLALDFARSGPTVLPELACLHGDRIQPPPKERKLKKRTGCIGKGSPTVIVENGGAAFSFDWELVQPEVTRFTRIYGFVLLGDVIERASGEDYYRCGFLAGLPFTLRGEFPLDCRRDVCLSWPLRTAPAPQSSPRFLPRG
jgi:hypothetical protein